MPTITRIPAAIVMSVPHSGLGGGDIGNTIDMGGAKEGGGPLGGGAGRATGTKVDIGGDMGMGAGGGTEI